MRPSPRTVPCCCWEVAFTERRPSWERPQQPSAPSSLLKEQQGLFLFSFFSKMWPLGSAMYTQQCDVACGEEPGELSETTLGILLLQWHFVELLVNIFEALRARRWDSVKVLPTSLCLSISLSLSLQFSLPLHWFYKRSLPPPHLWPGVRSSPGCGALARWLPENVVANPPVSCPFGEVKPRPPLGLKRDIFRVFFLSLGVSLSLIFP